MIESELEQSGYMILLANSMWNIKWEGKID